MSALLTIAALGATAMVFGSGSTVAGRQDALVQASRGESWYVGDAPPSVVFVSDSALAGIRWTGNLGGLTGTRWDARLESCRRLVYPSCRGREGYAPPTLLDELRSITAAGGVSNQTVLIVGVGYNDWESRFAGDVDAVMTEARRAGFGRVGWLSYRVAVSYQPPGPNESGSAAYAAMNRVLTEKIMAGQWPELVLIDYAWYTTLQPSWFTSDGVHLTAGGAVEVVRWLSDVVQFDTTPGLAPENWRSEG